MWWRSCEFRGGNRVQRGKYPGFQTDSEARFVRSRLPVLSPPAHQALYVELEITPSELNADVCLAEMSETSSARRKAQEMLRAPARSRDRGGLGRPAPGLPCSSPQR